MEGTFPYPRLSRSEADSGLEKVLCESAILLRRREAGTEHQAGEGQVGRGRWGGGVSLETPRQSRHRWVQSRDGMEEGVWKSTVLGVKRAAVRKAGCGRLSDPLIRGVRLESACPAF